MNDLDALVKPRSIAVIGASTRRHALGNQVLANLRRAAFGGTVNVVHGEAEEIGGLPTVRSISALPTDVDVALVSVPAAGCVATLEELERVGCAAAIVPAVGLGEDERRAIDTIRARSGMAICGPNTMGIHNVADGVPMLFWEDVLDEVRSGGVALVGQSGGACNTIVKTTEAAGFSRIIASGNEWGVTTSDYLHWLAEDRATTTVGIVIESLRDVEGFAGAVRLLREVGKRAVVLHAGRTEAGSVATAAHTSALVGRSDVYASFFAELDLPVVRDYDEMAAVLDTFSAPSLPRPRGSSVAVVTVSGGVAAVSADVASEYSIDLAVFSPATCKSLEESLPGAGPHNPFDAGAAPAYDEVAFTEALISLANAPEVDSLLVVLDGQKTLSAGEMKVAEEDFVGVADAAKSVLDTPMVIASTSSIETHPRWSELVGPRVPIVRGIGPGMAVMRAMGMNRRPVGPLRAVAGSDGSAPTRPSDQGGDPGELLAAYGLLMVKRCVVDGRDHAVSAAGEVGFPMVVKVVSDDIAHRSDVGGVVVGVTDHDALGSAVDEIESSVRRYCPDAQLTGFELQEHVTSRLEAMVGFVTDPVFGPVVSVGMGGVLVELMNDSAFALAPVTEDKALELIESTMLSTIAYGYRGLVEPTDLRPLASVVANFSRLAADNRDRFTSGDLNPVIVREGSGDAVIVDVLLTPTPEEPS